LSAAYSARLVRRERKTVKISLFSEKNGKFRRRPSAVAWERPIGNRAAGHRDAMATGFQPRIYVRSPLARSRAAAQRSEGLFYRGMSISRVGLAKSASERAW